MDLTALRSISYGLYIVGSKKDDSINAQIANSVVQVCSEPPTVSVAVNKGNMTHEYIRSSGVFSVSVLCEDAPLNLIGRFGFKSGRDENKFKDVDYKIGETGAPIVVEHAVAYLEARVVNEVDVNTHTMFIGELVAGEVLLDTEPMTYAHYHRVKGGTTPKSAPSYVAEQQRKEEKPKMAKYRCTVCGYIYDPEKGDPESDIAPGTAFEDLPDDWVCPVCGASKEQFEKVD